MLCNTNRTDAWSATTVGDGERLMQIQMAHVSTDCGRTCESDLRIHIRAIHIYQTAVCVDNRTNLFDGLFKDPVCGRIGDHQRTEGVCILFSFQAQVGKIDVAHIVTLNDYDFVARHDRTGGIRSVCRRRNQCDSSLRLFPVEMILAYHHETGEFTLGT